MNPGPDLPEVSESIQKLNYEESTNLFLFTTPGTVKKIIDKLSKKKALGINRITNTVLKFLPKNKILLLTNIINRCLRTCYFPLPGNWLQLF